MEKISVIIVTYNNQNHIQQCLSSLPWDQFELETVIVDNHSRDHTRNAILAFENPFLQSRILPIWNDTNVGYARAVNQALALCHTPWILLLGPDTVLFPNTISILLAILKKNPNVGMVAPQLLTQEGKIHPSCRRFPNVSDLLLELIGLPRLFPKKWKPRWKFPEFDHQTQQEVEQPEATCLLIRKEAIDSIGNMDEQFFLFFNDVDWCRRFWQKGWKILFIPEAKVYHIRGASVNQNQYVKIWKSHQGFYRYFQKYRKNRWEWYRNQLLGVLLIITAVLRILFSDILERGREKGKA